MSKVLNFDTNKNKSDRREAKTPPPVTPSVKNNFEGIEAPANAMPVTMAYDGFFKDFVEAYTADTNRFLASLPQQKTQLETGNKAAIEKAYLLAEIARLTYEKAQMTVIIVERDAEIQVSKIAQKEKNAIFQLSATENAARRFNMAAHGYTPETVSAIEVDETDKAVWHFLYKPLVIEHAVAQ